MDPASGFQSVLVALLLGHLLGDFVVQRRALLVLQPYLTWRPLGGWLVQLVLVGLVAVHAAIDVGKVRLAGESGDGVVAFLVDQIAHLATLVAAAAVLAPSPIESYAIFDPWLEPAIAPAVVIVAVVFAGGFLIRLLERGALHRLARARFRPPRRDRPQPGGEVTNPFLGVADRTIVVNLILEARHDDQALSRRRAAA